MESEVGTNAGASEAYPVANGTQMIEMDWGVTLENDFLAWTGDQGYDDDTIIESSDVNFSWLFGDALQTQAPPPNPGERGRPMPVSVYDEHIAVSPAGVSVTNGASPSGPECFPDLQNPSCGFRVCTALEPHHRKQLLGMLGTEIADIEPGVLSLSSLRYGVHVYSRFLAKEYPILHHRALAPDDKSQKALEDEFGLYSPPELMWAVISFGWSSLDKARYLPYRQAASKVQGILRRRIIAVRSGYLDINSFADDIQHPLLTFTSPIWLIQTLFLCLAFARYNGTSDAYGFSTLFHGTLVDVSLRDQMPKTEMIS